MSLLRTFAILEMVFYNDSSQTAVRVQIVKDVKSVLEMIGHWKLTTLAAVWILFVIVVMALTWFSRRKDGDSN